MSRSAHFKQIIATARIERAQAATKSIANRPLLPIGALLLAGSMGAMAQQDPTAAAKTLKPVVVTEKAEAPAGKDAVRAVETTIGKGKQQLRDIPQSLTVVTEKLIDDRNLDTLKEAAQHRRRLVPGGRGRRRRHSPARLSPCKPPATSL
jgi:outer membrane receptor for ferric coprogen and ferric-rhodotorulic acid